MPCPRASVVFGDSSGHAVSSYHFGNCAPLAANRFKSDVSWSMMLNTNASQQAGKLLAAGLRTKQMKDGDLETAYVCRSQHPVSTRTPLFGDILEINS